MDEKRSPQFFSRKKKLILTGKVVQEPFASLVGLLKGGKGSGKLQKVSKTCHLFWHKKTPWKVYDMAALQSTVYWVEQPVNCVFPADKNLLKNVRKAGGLVRLLTWTAVSRCNVQSTFLRSHANLPPALRCWYGCTITQAAPRNIAHMLRYSQHNAKKRDRKRELGGD